MLKWQTEYTTFISYKQCFKVFYFKQLGLLTSMKLWIHLLVNSSASSFKKINTLTFTISISQYSICTCSILLKLVSPIFYQVFMFSPNDITIFLFHENDPYLILYQRTKFQCHTFFPSQDIKQNEDRNIKNWISRERKELFIWKNIFHSFWRAIIWWKKLKFDIKIADTSFKNHYWY